VELTLEDKCFGFVIDAAGFADEADFSTTASEVGHRKEIGAEVRDIEDVLQDAHDPSSFSMHVGTYTACGNS